MDSQDIDNEDKLALTKHTKPNYGSTDSSPEVTGSNPYDSYTNPLQHHADILPNQPSYPQNQPLSPRIYTRGPSTQPPGPSNKHLDPGIDPFNQPLGLSNQPPGPSNLPPSQSNQPPGPSNQPAFGPPGPPNQLGPSPRGLAGPLGAPGQPSPPGGGSTPGVQQTQFNLSQALNKLGATKNKTQVGSAISLSLILIGMLKTIISTGPNGMMFYTPMLYLVAVTLGLQIVAGLLAIYIAMTKDFFNQYHRNLWRYGSKLCCSCCFPNTTQSNTPTTGLCHLHYDENNIKVIIAKEKCTMGDNVRIDNEEINCCHGVCCNNSGTYEPFELEIFAQFNIWKGNETRALLEIKNAEIDIKNKESLISDLQGKLKKQHGTDPPGSNSIGAHEQKILNDIYCLNAELDALKKRKNVCDKYIALGKILGDNVDNLRHKHVFMQASCLQNILCVLVYIIVALNTFTVTFGIISKNTPLSQSHANVTG